MPSQPPDAAAGRRHASDSPGSRRRALSRTELAAIAVPWVTALFLPAIRIVGGPPVRGIELLEHGWRAIDSGVVGWCANPLFGVAMLLAAAGAYAAAGCISSVGLVLALTSFAAPQVARASGAAVPELYFEPGFYLWLLACLALPAWCWSALWRRRR